MSGLAIEAATEHVEVAVFDADDAPLAHEVEEVGHGHTRRLAPLVGRALERAKIEARALGWVAADLGPGSFTGVRVGLATARGIAMASGARLLGAGSLAALAHGAGAKRAVVVPLVPAGRRDLYAGFFRADARAAVTLIGAPLVAPLAQVLERVREMAALLPEAAVRFVGPGAGREREGLAAAYPAALDPPWRFEGLSALDLARAARLTRGPAAGLPEPGHEPEPLYVRSAQAEERVRRRALSGTPIRLRPLRPEDVPLVAGLERRIFSDPWPASFFLGELAQSQVHARIADLAGESAGYSVAWLGHGTGHLGNLAVAPEARRRGVARVLLEDVLERVRERDVAVLTLEVRVSNFAAQWLYRAHDFRAAGLRRGYYRDTGEDALVMQWRAEPSAPVPHGEGV